MKPVTGALLNKYRASLPCLAAVLLGGMALTGTASAQTSALANRLEDLNVRVQTEHYALAGTVNDAQLREFGQWLEYIHREYRTGFDELLRAEEEAAKKKALEERKAKRQQAKQRKSRKKQDPPAEEDPPAAPDPPPSDTAQSITNEDTEGRFRVIIFATRQDYVRFGAQYICGGTEHSLGMFVPSLNLLLIQIDSNPDDTRRVLFHEAFHQFMRRYVADPPMWLNEGLAVHYGEAKPAGRGLTFSHPSSTYWRLCRKAVDKGREIPLWDVIRADRASFYDHTTVKLSSDWEEVPLAALYYGQAYTLIHTLLSDQSGRQRLRDYIRALAADKGQNTAQITQQYFGPDACARMYPFWVQHLKSRPETR